MEAALNELYNSYQLCECRAFCCYAPCSQMNCREGTEHNRSVSEPKLLKPTFPLASFPLVYNKAVRWVRIVNC